VCGVEREALGGVVCVYVCLVGVSGVCVSVCLCVRVCVMGRSLWIVADARFGEMN
jgi:hypothetical protein